MPSPLDFIDEETATVLFLELRQNTKAELNLKVYAMLCGIPADWVLNVQRTRRQEASVARSPPPAWTPPTYTTQRQRGERRAIPM
ncbi:hypothetical protein G6O67_000096 [Ophiocordyceps sinensis]|uniref:Uncharacterized protein n=1 Tax=Ophiocordyceps sinensis TaxID=72228 RepID=A0A8H4PYJ2_9HYPO|nr:hypothetical protein G6O67_000096 [Ophiocordyceps sinensis]